MPTTRAGAYCSRRKTENPGAAAQVKDGFALQLRQHVPDAGPFNIVAVGILRIVESLIGLGHMIPIADDVVHDDTIPSSCAEPF